MGDTEGSTITLHQDFSRSNNKNSYYLLSANHMSRTILSLLCIFLLNPHNNLCEVGTVVILILLMR